ncbi:MAG: M15 family metallopeptidase [Pseudomonadota bacterium]|nr:M15 family metallopeptidase [Pseudomonadota bacterium]
MEFALLFSFLAVGPANSGEVPTDVSIKTRFVDVAKFVPGLQVDLRYTGAYKLIGEPIDGYRSPRCLLTIEAVEALRPVQLALLDRGYTLKVYDCYRPQSAVDHFVRWAKDLRDTRMKHIFYPHVAKRDLFHKGYIARKSSHSRGSTADLTIVPLPVPDQKPFTLGKPFRDNSIDMGTPFDYFDPLSHTENPHVTPSRRTNRMLLKQLMEKAGFVNLEQEWWHYTLRDEPYPDTYFDFPVE